MLDLPWLLTLDFVCLLFYLQYWPIQTDASATGAANIGGLNFSCLFERAEIQIPVNKYECPQRLSFSPGNLFWGSFTNHNTGNYLRHGIDITTNQRLSPTFRGNRNTIIVGDSQTSPLPIFFWGRGDVCTQAIKSQIWLDTMRHLGRSLEWSILCSNLRKGWNVTKFRYSYVMINW